MPCKGPGPRQRRATKIANRSHVTPFDKLAQWNAQIMRLGTQGAVPSIVGNSLEFVKLTAADIPGVMNNPATEDLDMNKWDVNFATNGNINMTNGAISGVSALSSSNTLQISSQASTLVTGGRFEVQPVLGAEIKLQCSSTGLAGPINIVWPDTLDANGYNITIGGNRTSGSCQVNIMNNNYNGSASFLQLGSGTLGSNRVSARQIDIDAGFNGLQMGSDGRVTIDAATNIEIDAAGRLDLSGNQIYIDSDGAGVNIAAVNEITMDAAKVDVEATTKLDLSGTNMTINSSNNLEVKAGATLDLSSDNTKLNGTTDLEIIGSKINIGTSSSAVDISGQITLNNVSDLKATNITATGAIEGASFATPASRTGNTITTQGIITTGAITDGTATMSSGTITGLVSLTADTISDTSGATLTNGSMTGLIDVSTNSVTLVNTKFTSTSQTRDVSNAPYVWGVNYLEQIDPTDIYLLGNYKQIRSALFIWSGSEIITYTPPNNVPPGSGTGVPVVNPPCQGGGELLKLGTPQIWDLPTANYQAPNHTFTIPHLACRTMMTVELSVDIFYPHVDNSPLPDPPNYIDRISAIRFWLGKNAGGSPAVEGGESGPMAYRLSTLSPAYFGTNASQPTYSHYASITLMGGESLIGPPGTPQFEFRPGDTIYLTAVQAGTAGMFCQLKKFRVKVTWEALN